NPGGAHGALHMGFFGDVTFNAAMSYRGATIIDAGVFLHFIGNASALNTMDIQNWARIDIDSFQEVANHDRINDSAVMTMTGAGVQVNATSSGFDVNEKWGATNLTQGLNHFTVYPEIGQDASVKTDSLNFTNGAVLLLRGVNIGATSGTRTH